MQTLMAVLLFPPSHLNLSDIFPSTGKFDLVDVVESSNLKSFLFSYGVLLFLVLNTDSDQSNIVCIFH